MSTTILGTIDAGGEGKAVLLAALNQALGKNFTLSEFTFSDPVAITIPTPTRNTMIKLAPLAASGYYGVRKVYYNRIHVSELGQITVVRGAATSVSDLLPQINEKYGVFIQPTDIYDSLLPVANPSEPEIQINLNFRPTSIIFYGGVQITLGNNDPAAGGGSGGGAVLPFSGETMLFTTQTNLRPPDGSGTNAYVIDSFSTFIDTDKTRKRFANVTDDSGSMLFEKLYKRTYNVSDYENTDRKDLIVYSWRNQLNEVYAINIYGDVLKAASNGLSWTQVVSLISYNLENQAEVVEVQQLRPILQAARLPTGEVFVIAIFNNQVVIHKSDIGDENWSVVHTFGNLDVHGLNYYSILDYNVRYLDSLVHGGKLWSVVRCDLNYAAAPGSLSTNLAVEVLDLTTFAANYFTIGRTASKNANQEFESSDLANSYCIVTPENDLVGTPRVAALLQLKDSSRFAAVYYSFDGVGYEAEIVGNLNLSRDIIEDNSRFISAYSVSLQKDITLSLDVIEIGCRVPTDNLPYESYAMGIKERSQDGFMVYGVKVYTSVRGASSRNDWVESTISLGDGNAHKRILINTASKRMHYIAQPENALARIRFTEDNTIAGFRAAVDTSIVLDKHSGFSSLSGHGCGVFTNPTVLETLNTTYGLLPYSNEESTKAPINFSFIARDQQNNYKWLVSEVINSPLQIREFGREYPLLGKVPLLVAANGGDLFAWSQLGYGVFKSSQSGQSWSMVAQTEVYYDQKQSDKPDRNILGSAQIRIKPEYFRTGSIVNQDFVLDVEFNEQAVVTDATTKQFDKVLPLQDRVLFRSVLTMTPLNKGYENQNEAGGYGINFLGQYAPKKVQAWEADSSSNALTTVSLFTTNNASPYGERAGRASYSFYVEDDFVVIDLNTKVKFLDIDQALYGYRIINGSEVHMLKFVTLGGLVTTVELFGGSNPALNTFKPKAAFGLWEFADANYVPYVYYDDKKIVLVGRLREDGTFATTIHLINVPSDNGGTLDIVPMFNANRREYYFAQRDNGIFKLNYTYNTVTKTAVLSLNRVFTLNGIAGNMTIVSGAVRELGVISEPTVPLIPTFPVNGTLLNTFCDDTNKFGVYADGSGGTYNQLIENDSPDCGYVPPAPTPVGATTTTMTLNTTSATADLIETAVVANENGVAYAVYELSAGLIASTNLVLSVLPGSATTSDISSVDYRIGSGSFIAATLPQTITIPAGQTELVVRVSYVQDGITEGAELFTVRLAKSAGNTQITNTDPIDTVFTVNDSVIGARWPVVQTAIFLDDYENANKIWTGTTLNDHYTSPGAAAATATYVPADKVMRIVQDPVDDGTRGTNFILPPAETFRETVRLTIDLYIEKVQVRHVTTSQSQLIDYDAPLPADHYYVQKILGLTTYDDVPGSVGTAFTIAFCLENSTNQVVSGGYSASTTGPAVRSGVALGNNFVTIPRGGDIRVVLEITNEADVKRQTVLINGQTVLTSTLSDYSSASLLNVGAYIKSMDDAPFDIRRFMIEDMSVPTTTMSINTTSSFDGYSTDTSINASTEPTGAIVYQLSAAPLGATNYVVDIADGTAIASKMATYRSGNVDRVRTGENEFFIEEAGSFTNWTTSNSTFSVVNGANRLTKTNAGSGASATIPITFPSLTKDWLIYGKVRSSNLAASDISAIFLLNGAKETSIWFGTATANSSFAAKRISINGTQGASTLIAAPAITTAGGNEFEYDTEYVEFVLHHDQYFDCLSLWLKKADGTWYFSARVQCDAFSAPQLMIAKGGGAPAGSWFEFEYLQGSTPNFFAIGDSVTAGSPNFSPNPGNVSSGRQDYWAASLMNFADVRNNFVVNRGVGSQSSAQILSRIPEIVSQQPQLVFLGLSSNDQILGVSPNTRKTNIQNSINQINAQCGVVVYNGVYGTQASTDNTPSAQLKTYMSDLWDQHIPELTGDFIAIDTMKALVGSDGFMDPAYTHGDGIHPNSLGYARVGALIGDTLNNRVKSLVFRSGTTATTIFELPATVSFEANQPNAVLVINSNDSTVNNTDLEFTVSIMKEPGNTSVFMDTPLVQTITLESQGPSAELIPTTWSTTLPGPNKTLSNGNLTGSSGFRVLTEFSATSGKYYVELSGDAGYMGVAATVEDEAEIAPGLTNYSIAYARLDGGIYVNGQATGTVLQTNASILRILLDIDNKLVWFFVDGNTSPAVLALQGDAFRIAAGEGTTTINAGASPFTYTVPDGCTPGFGQDLIVANDTRAFTATRLNLFDKGSAVTLDTDGLLASFGYYTSSVRSKLSVNSGKWAVEVRPTISPQYAMVGISPINGTVQSSGSAYPGNNLTSWSYYGSTGEIYNNDTGTAYGPALQAGDVLTMLLDMDNGTLSYMVNGVNYGVAKSGLSGYYFAHFGDGASTNTQMLVNFGSEPFQYPVPVGYTQGFGVEDIVPTKYNSVLPKTLGNYATITNGGDFVDFSGVPASTAISYRKVSTGKWAWEVEPTNDSIALRIGISRPNINAQAVLGTGSAPGYGYQGELGDLNGSAYGADFANNDVITVLLDLDSGTLSYMKNGVDQGVAATGLTGEWVAAVCKTSSGFYPRANTNFGDRPFKYPVPAGYTKGLGHFR